MRAGSAALHCTQPLLLPGGPSGGERRRSWYVFRAGLAALIPVDAEDGFRRDARPPLILKTPPAQRPDSPPAKPPASNGGARMEIGETRPPSRVSSPDREFSR